MITTRFAKYFIVNKMYCEEIINKVRELYIGGQGLHEIARNINIPYSTVRYFIKNDYKRVKKKRGPKFKITSREKTRIKKEVRALALQKQRVTAKKIKSNCDLDVSIWTTRRELCRQGFKFVNVEKYLPLTKKHKNTRQKFAIDCIRNSHRFNLNVFSDEKRFCFDGPDSWGTYCDQYSIPTRIKCQIGGGGVMVLGCVLPDGFIYIEWMKGNVKATDYRSLLQDKVKPLLDSKFEGGEYYFQQDNASIHTATVVDNWFKSTGMKLFPTPSRSPDLNIMENISKMMCDYVYDGPQFNKVETLWQKIQKSVEHLMQEKPQGVVNLYYTYNHRLADVTELKGEQTKY